MPRTAPPAPNRTMSPPTLRRRLDQLGIGLAGICALHCLLTLAVISVLGLGGLGGHFLLDESIHRIGLVLALGVGGAAIGWGLLRHRRMLPFAVAIAGIALMAGALAIPHGANEFLLTLGGVALVSMGHWLNLRAARAA
jgi:MerC mercury resistance protein